MSDSDFQNPDGKENQAERGLKGESPFIKQSCLHVHALPYTLHLQSLL